MNNSSLIDFLKRGIAHDSFGKLDSNIINKMLEIGMFFNESKYAYIFVMGSNFIWFPEDGLD